MRGCGLQDTARWVGGASVLHRWRTSGFVDFVFNEAVGYNLGGGGLVSASHASFFKCVTDCLRVEKQRVSTWGNSATTVVGQLPTLDGRHEHRT